MTTVAAPVRAGGAPPRGRAAGSVRRPFLAGAREIAPFVIGVLPIALAVGTLVSSSSVPALTGWLAGPLIFGGAAQLLTIQLLDAGAAPAAIIASALLVNSRVLMYSAAIAPWYAQASLRARLLVAVPLIDPLFLAAQPRFERGDLDQRERLAWWAGAATLLVVCWMAVQGIAQALSTSVPQSADLHMAAPLVFVGVLAKLAHGRPAVAAAAVAAAVAVVGTPLPFQSAMSLGIVAGLLAAVVVSRRGPVARAGATS